MKPVPFDYFRPASLDETCALLADEADSRVIAGGQSLVPMLAMRLARPERLVDIIRLPELSGVRDAGSHIVIGATTRQAAAEAHPRHYDELPCSERRDDSAAHAEAGLQDCNAEQLRLLIVYLCRHHVVMGRIVECAPGAGKGRIRLLEILLARLPG